MKKKLIYISGKITGLDDYAEKFSAAKKYLIGLGLTVINPVECDHSKNKDWHEFMITDLKYLFQCDAIYMLNNWSESTGARIEHFIAQETGMKIFYQPSAA